MKPKIHFRYWHLIIVVSLLTVLAGCNLPGAAPGSPTTNVTQAYQTVAARLTQAALTPLVITPPLLTEVATAAISAGTPSPQPSPMITEITPTLALPTVICDLAAPGVPIDVTIDDYTKMLPGQAFTKTWRLYNAGSCTWTAEYSLAWFSGPQMGTPASIALKGNVTSGSMVDLSVDMVAPMEPGTYQSNWKLRNPAGVLFGIGPAGASPFWVLIVVVQPATLTPTPPTLTPTATATPGVQVSGTATLVPNDVLNLDTNQINSGGEDLAFLAGDQNHLLDPVNTAAMSVFGGTQPSFSDCLGWNLSADALVVEDLPPGTYLCYRTNLALPGWARVVSFDVASATLTLEILTWSLP